MKFYRNIEKLNNVEEINNLILNFKTTMDSGIHKYSFNKPQFSINITDSISIGNITDIDKELTDKSKFAGGLYTDNIYTISYNKNLKSIINRDMILSLLDKKYLLKSIDNSNKYFELTYGEYIISYIIDYSDDTMDRYMILYPSLSVLNYFFFPNNYVEFLKKFNMYMENTFYQLLIEYIEANNINYEIIG